MRLIIVVRSDLAAKANIAAKQEDTKGGDHTFTVPLAQPATPTTPAAYWCSWDFGATKNSIANLKTFLGSQGFTVGALDAGGSAVNADKSIAVFDAAQWTPDQVLTRVGLIEISTAKP